MASLVWRLKEFVRARDATVVIITLGIRHASATPVSRFRCPEFWATAIDSIMYIIINSTVTPIPVRFRAFCNSNGPFAVRAAYYVVVVRGGGARSSQTRRFRAVFNAGGKAR